MLQRPIRQLIEKQKIIVAPPQTTVLHAAKIMQQNGLGTIMVVDGKRLVGIFTERDALYRVMAEGRDAKITMLAQVMTDNPQTVHPDKPLAYALQLMFEGRFRHVPVVEDGYPIGIVSVRDALSGDLNGVEPILTASDHASEVLG